MDAGKSRPHLLGVGRPAERHNGPAFRRNLRDDLAHAQQAVVLDSLGHAHPHGARRETERARRVPHHVRRHGIHGKVGLRVDVAHHVHRFRQQHARQQRRAFARRAERLRIVLLAAPQPHGMAVQRQPARQGKAPATRADHLYVHGHDMSVLFPSGARCAPLLVNIPDFQTMPPKRRRQSRGASWPPLERGNPAVKGAQIGSLPGPPLRGVVRESEPGVLSLESLHGFTPPPAISSPATAGTDRRKYTGRRTPSSPLRNPAAAARARPSWWSAPAGSSGR